MTIAHFVRSKALLGVATLLAIAIGIYSSTLYPPYGQIVTRIESQGNFWLPAVIFAWIGAFFSLFFAVSIAKRILFDNGKAILIDAGTLIYLNKWCLSVACDDVEDILSETFGISKRKVIIVLLRNGRKRIIPTGSLSESREAVISRLKIELGLL